MTRGNATEFASYLGVSSAYVSQLKKDGVITRGSDKKFDFETEAAKVKSKTDPARIKRKGKKLSPDLINPAAPIATEADAALAISLIKQVLQEEGRQGPTVIDFDAARTADTILKARERWLSIQVESRKLVDRAEVERAIAKLAREDRDALVNWPAKISPLMAADLGVEQVIFAVIFEKYVREFLAQRGDARLRLGGAEVGGADVGEVEAA